MSLSEFFIDPATLPTGFYGYVQLFTLAAVYTIVLYKATKFVAEGSEILQLILPPGLVGSIVLPVAGAIPDGALVLFAGLGDDAQEKLNIGMGTLAGSTVMVLTVPFAFAVLAGRVDLRADGKGAAYSQRPHKLTRPTALITTGISTSRSVLVTAVIMLASSAVYLVVQGVAWAGDTRDGAAVALAGLIMCAITFVMYLLFQLFSQSAQDAQEAKHRALLKEAYKSQLVDFVTLFEIEHAATAGGSFSAPSRKRDIAVSDDVLRGLFDKYDSNNDGSIDVSELRVLLRDAGVKLSQKQLAEVMADVGGDDMRIQMHELETLVQRMVNARSRDTSTTGTLALVAAEAFDIDGRALFSRPPPPDMRHMGHSQGGKHTHADDDAAVAALLTPKLASAKQIQHASKKRVVAPTAHAQDVSNSSSVDAEGASSQTARLLGGSSSSSNTRSAAAARRSGGISNHHDEEGADIDDEEEEEEEEGAYAGLTSRQLAVKACIYLGIGLGLVTLFSDPMVDVLSEFASRTGINAFYVSFLLTPLITNASEALTTVIFASKKSQSSIDMSLASLLGGATMNNTFTLGIFLSLVYFRALTWSFSAEVTAILFVQAAIVLFLVSSHVIPTWRAIIPAALFPASVLLIWVLENKMGWN